MSKKGNCSIFIPKGVNIELKNMNVQITGPLGALALKISCVDVNVINNLAYVKPQASINKYKKYHGLYRSLIQNMVIGVTQGFHKHLSIKGVGCSFHIVKKNLAISIGFSHIVIKKIPNMLSVFVYNQYQSIRIEGIDKHKVGLFSASIRSIKKPDSYLGKGIRYNDEDVVTKEGKNKSK